MGTKPGTRSCVSPDPLFSTVAHGPTGHDRGMKMVTPALLAPDRRSTGALFRPVPHAPMGHHRIMKLGRVGRRLPPGDRRRRSARAWCREPADQCDPGHPKAPPTVAPCGEARPADSAAAGAPGGRPALFSQQAGCDKNRTVWRPEKGAPLSPNASTPRKNADHDCGTRCGTAVQHEPWLNGQLRMAALKMGRF